MTEWLFKSFRPVNPRAPLLQCRRFPIRCASGVFTGTESQALAFARRACEHLKPKEVVRVEAWSPKAADPSDLTESITFRLRQHGRNWIAEQNTLHHGGIWPDLDSALNYCLFRGAGKLCRIELLNQRDTLTWLVLTDQTANHPYAGKRPAVGQDIDRR